MTDIHALVGAYALDAVNDLERTAFARHLAECEACALEVAELRETAARLADPSAVAPPPRLRTAVLAEISRTPQERGRREPAPAGAALTRWRRWTATAAAAGVIAAGAGAVTWAVADQRVRDERGRLAVEQDRSRRVADVLAAPDARVRRLAMPRGGQITLVVAPSRDAAVVVLRDLPAQPVDRAYQLWLLGDGSPRPVDLLAPGRTELTEAIGPLAGATTFGLSVEPSVGSPRPTDVVGTVELR